MKCNSTKINGSALTGATRVIRKNGDTTQIKPGKLSFVNH